MNLKKIKDDMMENSRQIIREITQRIDSTVVIRPDLIDRSTRILGALEYLDPSISHETEEIRTSYQKDFETLKNMAQEDNIVTKIELLSQVESADLRHEFIKNINQINADKDFTSLAQALPSKEVVKILHENGFNFNLTNKDGQTLLDMSMEPDNETGFYNLMEIQQREKSIFTQEQLNEGLITTINQEDLVKMQTIINSGANVNAVSEEGITPIGEAVIYGNPEAINLLCTNDANVNYINAQGQSALTIAEQFYPTISDVNPNSEEDKELLINILKEHGADINAVDERGHTSLEIAYNNNDIELMKTNVDLGAVANEEIKRLILEDRKAEASTSQENKAIQSQQATNQYKSKQEISKKQPEKRKNLTPEQKEKKRNRMREYRKNLAPEKKEEIRKKQREYRKNLAPEKKEEIRKKQKEHRKEKKLQARDSLFKQESKIDNPIRQTSTTLTRAELEAKLKELKIEEEKRANEIQKKYLNENKKAIEEKAQEKKLLETKAKSDQTAAHAKLKANQEKREKLKQEQKQAEQARKSKEQAEKERQEREQKEQEEREKVRKEQEEREKQEREQKEQAQAQGNNFC